MSALAPVLEAFFTERLMTQRRASPNTITAYRDTFKLLLGYACQRTGKLPSRLDFADLDAPLISGFLQHLETKRGNSVTTRNARLAAIHSLFGYAALKVPEHAALIARVLAIPTKRHDHTTVSFLTRPEIDALLAAPDLATWHGRRDHALLLLATQTGLRVSELTGLTIADVHLGPGAHVYCRGKGRKERCTPLTTQTIKTLKPWLAERSGDGPDPLFCTRRGARLSRDAVERLLAKYVATAVNTCPSLQAKAISPHTLRHSAAMSLLHAGVDVTVIALWLGHESPTSSRVYLHADMEIKERALARTAPPHTKPGRYTAPDSLLAFLDGL
ncbi:tyrosine-type recombinase/integrase [Nonomuraea sp. 10N515B]|uniref:tyrosine-type recombinase/integrase n=1 Tax=Nonomuraea sp. 10N515B TaxID=3457422 RepID=UPI003FCE6A38